MATAGGIRASQGTFSSLFVSWLVNHWRIFVAKGLRNATFEISHVRGMFWRNAATCWKSGRVMTSVREVVSFEPTFNFA